LAVITQNHPNVSKNPKTFTTAKHVIGNTALSVSNTEGFAQYNYVLVGELGSDSCELRQIASLTGVNTMTVDALVIDHPINTPITFLPYNKVRFYRSTDGGVTYSINATKDIAVASDVTFNDDGASVTSYYYKNTFYNTYLTRESGASAAITGAGYQPYALKAMQDRVLALFPDVNETYITRELITGGFQDFQDELVTKLMKANRNYFTTTNTSSPSSLVSGTDTYDLPAGCIYLIRLDVAYDGATYRRAIPSSPNYGMPEDVYNKNVPIYDFLGVQFRLRPTPDSSSGKYKYWAETLPAQLENPEDELNIFLRPWKRGFIYKGLQTAKMKDPKSEEAERYGKMADRVLADAINLLSTRQEDGGLFMEISDPSFLYSDEQFPIY
jgi:hypothetical protein